METIVLGVAAILVVLPGGYLLKISTSVRYSEGSREARILLTGKYIRVLEDLFIDIANSVADSGLTVGELLSGDSYIPQIRDLNQILSTRDSIGQNLGRLQRASLYARNSLLALIVLLISSLVRQFSQIPDVLVFFWLVGMATALATTLVQFLRIFSAERILTLALQAVLINAADSE